MRINKEKKLNIIIMYEKKIYIITDLFNKNFGISFQTLGEKNTNTEYE